LSECVIEVGNVGGYAPKGFDYAVGELYGFLHEAFTAGLAEKRD
jgi:hypothetical protein